MTNYSKLYLAKPGKRIRLSKIDPANHEGLTHHGQAETRLKKLLGRIVELQAMLYAEKKQSLLIVLQGLDAAGKDGVVRHVLTGLNPEGVKVAAFKQPTGEEQSHDFLWRVHPHAPARGEIAIFNRSHYEDVLVARVHKLVPPKIWKPRYGMINDFERLLSLENETVILKFFLHISPNEQLARFKVRLDEPDREWKISNSDYSERELWDAYTDAFEQAIQRTSTKEAPWFIIPSDHKWFRDFAISQIIVDTLEGMRLAAPKPEVDIRQIRSEFSKAERKLSKKDRISVAQKVVKKEKAIRKEPGISTWTKDS
ncbi:MAG: polyphosphate kinase 2 family protein [bacterium]